MRRLGTKDAICVFAAFLYSLPAWAYPFGNDQALHWYIGRRWLDGELPFVSAISSKPIGMFGVHAITTALLGEGTWQLRVTESFTVLCVGWLLALCARPLGRKARDGEWGLGALVFSGLYYTFFDYWDTAHPELWEAACVLAAFVVALRAPTPWQRDAGAGALATLAFMFKFPAALPALGVSALCAVRAVREREPAQGVSANLSSAGLAVLVAAGRFLCGVLPVVILCVLPFAVGGRLETMWEILGVYIFHYADQAPPSSQLPQWLRVEHGGGLLVITSMLTVVSFVVACARRDRDALWRLNWLVLVACLSAGSVMIQKRYFPYHFVAISTFLGALCTLGVSQSLRAKSAPSWSTLAAVAVAVAVAFYAGPLWTSGNGQSYASFSRSLIAYKLGKADRDTLLARFTGRSPLDAPSYAEHVAAQINRLKLPGDTLCTRGFLTPLYPLTGLRCTSRHIVEDNVHSGLPDWKREYKSALAEHPPTFMVTFSDRPRDLKYLEKRGYKLVYQEHLFRVLRFRAPAAATPAPPKI